VLLLFEIGTSPFLAYALLALHYLAKTPHKRGVPLVK